MATRADLLFMLAEPTEHAEVLEGAEEWVEPLRAAGVSVDSGGSSDLVVAPGRALRLAAGRDAPTILFADRVRHTRLRAVGLVGWDFLPIPSFAEPAVLLPLDDPRAARYALSRLSAPPSLPKVLRNRAIGAAIAAGVKPPGTFTVATREGRQPYLVRAAMEMGLPDDLDWLLALGRWSERGVFHLFEPGRPVPSWILKFSRAPLSEVEPPTDADGLGLVGELGARVVDHAPRILGVSDVGGRPVVVESAAVGAQLVFILRAPTRRRRKIAIVDAVATWLVELGAASLGEQGACRPAGLEAAERIAPAFGVDFGALLADLGESPTVLEHGDVGLEHVIVDGHSFVVIDWERAQKGVLPFADIAHFLARALPLVDGEVDDPAYGSEGAFARLFRGESESAPLLFRWLGQACEAWALPREAVGPLLSVVWLRLAEVGIRRYFAEIWFSDPQLGSAWPAWSGQA